MRCLICRNLELAFETPRNRYIEAIADASSKISTRLAAYWNVEMERARNDLDDHRAVCVFFASDTLPQPAPHRQFAEQTPLAAQSIAPAA